MPVGDEHEHQRLRRAMWASLWYLLAFAVLILGLVVWFLIPAGQAARDATPGERQQLSAWAMLLLALVLLIVFVGIVLTFRVSRYFFPRARLGHEAQRSRTQYVDAWAESARRVRDSPPEPDGADEERA